jgi:L-ascorbate peroxidase
MAVTKEELKNAQDAIDAIIKEKCCGPILVRLAWHDSGTYDKNLGEGKKPWPEAGGAIGSIRFAPEIEHGANKGLIRAIELLEPVKAAVPAMSYADIFQMASARAIALAGGPIIDMKYVALLGINLFIGWFVVDELHSSSVRCWIALVPSFSCIDTSMDV